jgi:geranylgeranyl diphosphate synthase type I
LANPALNIEARRSESLPAVFHRYRSEISAALRESLAGDGLAVNRMLRYSMGWADVYGNPIAATEGKTLRPTLCLLACEATGGSARKALPAAVSLELIHNFSLIHDDIQDHDEMRRHRRTLWAVWGEPKALVAGNALRTIADRCLWRLVDGGVGFPAALDVEKTLTAAYLDMIEGQFLDLQYEGRPDIGLSDYLGMISLKTGALIRCALVLGAMIGTNDPRTVDAFRQCGRSLGLVFQVRDDILGVWGEEEFTGKPVGADIRRKKNAFPVVYAMSQARGRDKGKLEEIYRKPTVGDEEVATVLRIMQKVGARQYGEDLAAEHSKLAMNALSAVELAPEALADIWEVSQFLLVREH